MDCKRLISVLVLSVVVPAAMANPEGAQVVQGNASFTRPDANTLNVTNSRNAIINWQQFNIDRGQTTRFIQPDRNSAVLNRVLSNNPSKIHGNLRSNGQVFLINQHGLMVGSGATIDTAGFYGSTLNLTDADFLNGKLNFSGGGLGGINNQGYIHAGPDGNVVLIAPDITNGGVIEVDGGNVILAAGESIRISSLNDGLIEFDVQAPDNSILNLGTIIAKQGAARLFAGNLQHSGAINATGLVRNADGSISLVASHDIEVTAGASLTADGADGGDINIVSEQGTTRVSGRIDARGGAGRGGRIRLLGEQVGVFDKAQIDASGTTGGGEILVGGDYQGANPAVQNARATFIGAEVELNADATGDGDGGRIIVWSDEATRSYGVISARGGPRGGDGGFVETSGGYLDLGKAVPNVSAATGAGGEWLIDPDDIEIVTGVGTEDPLDNYLGPFVSAQDPTQLGAGLIGQALDADQTVRITTGNVGASAGNITLTGNIVKAAGGSAALIFEAHNDIILNGNISSTSGALNITLSADAVLPDLNGQIFLNGTINALGGTVDFASGQAVAIGGTNFSNLTFANGGGLPQSLSANATFDSVTLGMDFSIANGVSLFVANSLTLADGITVDKGNSSWLFTTTGNLPVAMVGGTGSATINNAGGTLTAGWGVAGQTLEIGAGVTLQGYGTLNQSSAAPVLNNGSIIADTATQTFTVNPATLTNNGTLGVSNGTLTINSASYTSTGTFQVTGGVLNLGGGTSTGTLGAFTRSGGLVNITGTMTNTGNTLDIGGTGLFGAGGLNTLSGTLLGGTLSSGDATPLNSSNGTLDAVTMGSNLTESGLLFIRNSLTLADGITVDKGNSSWLFTTTGNLPVAMLGGTGSATINNAGGTLTAGWGVAGQTLEIGAGVTLQGYGTLNQSSAAPVLNNGSIIADTATQTFTVNPATLTNNGTLGVSNGTLTINSASYTSTGTFQVTGGVLNLGGGTSTGTLGAFTRSGGLVNITGTMTNTGNTLDIGGTGLFGAGGLNTLSGTLLGGTLSSGDATPLNSSNGTLDAVTMGSNLTESGLLFIRNSLTLADGITVDKGNSSWLFTTTGNLPVAMLGGTGSATINNAGGTLTAGWGVAGQTLEIGAGVTLQGYGNLNQSSAAILLNNGSIIANTAAQTFTVSPATVTSNGGLSVTAGTLTLSGANFTNTGALQVSGGILNLNNPTDWTNTTGTLDLTAGTINFGASFSVANFGSFTRSGGLANITGTLTNTGNTLDIGGAGLFGAGGLNNLSGTIVGGTLLNSDASPTLNASNGTLDGVTIGSDLTEAGTLFIRNSLTLSDGITIDKGNSSWLFTTTGPLPVAMLGGTGSATINNAGGTLTAGWGVAGQTLEIGAGVTLQGYGNLNQSSAAILLNNGSIIANTAAQTFTVSPATVTSNGGLSVTAGTLTLSGANFTNTGALQVSGGILNLNNPTDWTNTTGTLDLTAGTINFGASFSVANFGSFTRSGGLANITGTLTNTGNTLDIGGAGLFGAGGLNNLSGTIVGGTLLNSDASPTLNASNGTLDGVTIGSDLTEAGTLFIRNSLTLSDGITINKGNSSWLFTTTGPLPVAMLGGTGSATINNAGGTLTAGWGVTGQTLEIGAGVTLQGYGNLNQSSAATIVNNGSIIANTAAQTFTVSPTTLTSNGGLSVTAGTLTLSGASFTNTGAMQVSGGILNLNNPTDWTNTTGTLDLTAGTINFGASFSVANFGIFTRSGGLANITGTMTNTGNTLDVGGAGLFGLGGLNNLSGTIIGGTLVNSDASPTLTALSGTLDAVTIGSDLTEAGTLFIRNSLTLSDGITIDKGNSSWLFTTTGPLPVAMLGGTGSATINNAGGTLTAGWGVAGQTLEIGAGVTLQGYGNLNQSSAAILLNNGSIIANTAAQTFTVSPATVTSNGGLSVTAGTLTLSGANFTNTGALQVSGGILNLNNPTDWTNTTGTLDLTAGTINFGASFSVANFGSFTRSGGLANITGTLTNTGNTLDIGGAGLFGAGGLGTLSGTISGGTLISGDGTPLTASSGTLDGVTIGSDLTEAGTLFIRNSLTLSDGITIDKGNSSWLFTTTGPLPVAMLGGTGSATINNAGGTLTAGWGVAGQTLEIGAGVTLQGYGNLNQSSAAILLNNGSIIANTAAQTFTVSPATVTSNGGLSVTAGTLTLSGANFTNTGALQVSGGILNLNNPTDWTNTTGTLDLTAGTINFGASFSVANFGSFTRSGGLANITGTLTNTGNTLDIGGAGLFGAGGLNNLSGTIVGGTLLNSDASPTLGSASGTVDGVTIGSNLAISGALFLDNSLTLENGITVDKANNTWYFTTTGPFPVTAVSGSATITSSGGSLIAGWGAAGQTLTFGAGVSLQGSANLAQSSAATIVNDGNIIANNPGQTLTINVATFINNTQISVANGGILSLQNSALTNNALVTVGLGSTVTTGSNNFTNNGTVEGAGNFNVGSGVFTNSGTVAPGIGANNTGVLTITGDYAQTAGGLLNIEIEGTIPGVGPGFHDQLVVTDVVTLAGDLTVTEINGYTSIPLDTYQILTAATSLSGTFDGALSLPGTFLASPGYSLNAVDLLSVFTPTIVWDDEAGDSDWFNPVNWDDLAGNNNILLPTVIDDVEILSGGTISFTVGAASINALVTDQSLSMASGTLDVASFAVFNGDLSITGGTYTTEGQTQIDGTSFTLSNATVSSAGAGSLTTTAAVITTLSGATLNNVAWFNQSTTTWTGGNLVINGGTLTNDGAFNAGPSVASSITGSGSFINMGSLINTGGPVTTIGVAFDNIGSIGVNTNTLQFTNTLTNSGSITIANDSTLILDSESTHRFDLGTTLVGGSNNALLQVTAGDTLDVTAPLTPGGAGLILDLDGVLANAQNLTIPNTVDATGGTISGSGSFITPVSSTTTVNGTTFSGLVWNSQGAVDWTGANFVVNGVFTNNGVFTDSTTGADDMQGTGSFANAGTYLAAGTGASRIILPFTNIGGTVDIASGSTLDLNGATLNLGASGVLQGNGGVAGSVSNNGAIIRPGGVGLAGTLSIGGNLVHTAGSIEIEIESSAVFDVIAVVGQADLNDNLTLLAINGYTVSDGDSITPVTYGSSTAGNFSVINAIGGETITPGYGPVDFSILLNIAAGSVSWVGGIDNFWNTAGNWSGGIVPGSGDDVTIPTAFNLTIAANADANTLSLAAGSSITITTGTLTLANTSTLAGDLTINGLTAGLAVTTGNLTLNGTTVLGEGSLAVPGTITATGPVQWNPATSLANFAITGAGNFNAIGGFDIGPGTAGETLTLDKNLVINAASIWNGDATLITGTGSIANNAAIAASNTGTAAVDVAFANNLGGTLTKTSVGSLLSFIAGLTNAGLIDVQDGTVQTTTAFVNDGTIDVSGFGSTFDAAAGFTNGATGLIIGNGTLIAPSNGTGLLNQGRIEPGDVNTIGQLNLTGDFTNAVGGNLVLDLQAPLPDPLQDRLQILGQAFLDGTLTLNAVGGYTVVDGHQFNPVAYFGGAVGSFTTIMPIAGETVTPVYNPTPLLLTLNLGAPAFIFSNSTGNWNTAANWSSNLVPGIGDNVDLGTATVTIAAAATANTLSLAAGGQLTITGGGLTLANNSTLDGRLILQGGTLALGGSTLTLNGRFDWSATSTISNGTLSMPAASRFNVTGGATNTLLNVTANIAAPTAYSGGNLVLSNSTFNNTGNFDLQGPRLVNGIGTALFNNQDGGTLTKSSGSGVGGFIGTTAVTSLGSVAVQSGTLNLNGATVNLDAGDVLSSGTTGTLVANVINNGGTIRPGGAGAVGQLSIQGNYTNNSGALEVEIDGVTTNDVLAVTGTTNFGAAAALSVLDVSYLAYVPTVGESHTFITCTIGCSTGGGFGTLNQPGGITHSVAYDSPGGQVRLVVDSVSFAWIGPSGGAWGNGVNWSLGVAPDATIDVVLPALNVSINGAATANSLIVDTGGLLTINGGGNLSLASTLRVRSGATLNNSGTLAVAGLTTVNGSYTQNTGANTTLAGLTVGGAFGHNGGAATVAGAALFTGSLGVSGGTLTLSGASAAINGPFDMTAGSIQFGTGANSIGGTNNLWQGGTLRSTSGQQTLALQAGATLQLQGAATKTLRDIVLDMSLGDVNLFGSGNLVLSNAVIDNTNGTSFHSYGNGSLTGDATSQFINNGGLFENVSGVSQIAVDFINNNTSQVRVLSGSLTLLDTDLADQAAYSTALPGTLGFAAPRTLTGSLVNAGTLAAIGPTTTLTLPSGFTNTGNVALDQATLNLNGQTLTLPAGKILSGRGTIENGQVVNNGGVVLVGGAGQLGNLTLDGDYTQNAGSTMVVEVFNNGNTNQTASDTFTVTSAGNTTLNGGALVIGFTSNSAGLVLADVSPLQLANAPTGQFGQVIDAGGNILGFRFSGGVLTILGVTPKTPTALIDDLVGFIQNKEEIREIIESNESLAQIIGDEIARRREQEEQEQEDSSLICTAGA